jgi:hypothetical protein
VETMHIPHELAFERLGYEEKYHRAVRGYMKRLADLYLAIHDRFGEEGLQLIREVSAEYGRRVALNVKKKGEIKGVPAVGKYLIKIFDMVSDDWEIMEFSKDRLVIGVSRCPYPFTDDRICRAHTRMEEALVAELDDGLEYGIGRSIPQGDQYCEHILCERGTGK